MDATRMLNTTSNDFEVSENEETSSQKRHSYSIWKLHIQLHQKFDK